MLWISSEKTLALLLNNLNITPGKVYQVLNYTENGKVKSLIKNSKHHFKEIIVPSNIWNTVEGCCGD